MKNLAVLFAICFISISHSQIKFTDQAEVLGVGIPVGTTFLGNGVSFYDFDNDGWDDLTFSTSDSSPVRFFRNNNGSFVEIFLNITLPNYQTKSVTWVDFDNDGDNDLFITSDAGSNKLLENIGNMTFQDITSTSGLPIVNLYTYGASWGDYDNDGFLDVFLSNRTFFVSNKLYKNNGDGTFSDVTFFAGIDITPLWSFCSAFIDINNDGYQDIYVANDKYDFLNKMYKNNGDGTFTDISDVSGTAIGIDAMSVTVDDYNSDGFFDIYVTNGPGGNYLLRNNGDETFTNVAGPTGTTFNSAGWGAVFYDADNNKDLDLYVSAEFDGFFGGYLSAAFYENGGIGNFTIDPLAFPNDNRESFSNAIGDIDNDGLVDMVVTNNDDANIFLWRNGTTPYGNWLKVSLEGTISNRDAVGSRIEISINGQKQFRYTLSGEGYLSQNSGIEHFGVANATIIDYLKITWPSGTITQFNNVPVNQQYNITEGDDTLGVSDFSTTEAVIYPNPTEDKLYVQSIRTIDEIRIVNLLGQTVLLSKHLIDNAIDLSDLSTGHYIVLLKSEGYITEHKLIKQ